jgi:hypothetical protein
MHWKSALGTALIVVIVLAILWRVPALKTPILGA